MPVPTGLPAPRVQDPDLARWIEAVAQRLQQFDGTVQGINQRLAGGAGAAAGPALPVPGVPSLSTPPKPVQVSAIGGIGKIAVTWGNPFRVYVNHAMARVYRHTADAFDQAQEIGQARYVLFVDENVVAGTTYWYWVRFESTASILGPVSDSAMRGGQRRPGRRHPSNLARDTRVPAGPRSLRGHRRGGCGRSGNPGLRLAAVRPADRSAGIHLYGSAGRGGRKHSRHPRAGSGAGRPVPRSRAERVLRHGPGRGGSGARCLRDGERGMARAIRRRRRPEYPADLGRAAGVPAPGRHGMGGQWRGRAHGRGRDQPQSSRHAEHCRHRCERAGDHPGECGDRDPGGGERP